MRIILSAWVLILGGVWMSAAVAQDVPLVYDVENTGADCAAPPLPSLDELTEITSLPDPFAWSDGSGRVSTLEEWRCRRAEIGMELQHYELGEIPGPPESIESSFADGKLTVVIKEGDRSLTLTSDIILPEGEGPFPAIIGIGRGAGSLPASIFTERGIALIQYNFGQLAPAGFGGQVKRGTGGFFELYPDRKSAGYYVAWPWGVSRIIDGLEQTTGHNINLSRLAISGCSFAGKMALFSAAFDERIALTIAQEPGGGGAAAWRVSETLEGEREVLRRAQGAPWYRDNFNQFNQAVDKLPYDHHELMAMIAPRALLVLGNPDYEWLAEESGHVSCKAAHEVWKAMGVPERFGFSIVAGHGHCQLPDSQVPEVAAFAEKFLLGNNEAETMIETTPYSTDLTPWITWETPQLR